MALEVDGKCAIGKRPVFNGVFRFTSFDAALRFSRDVLDLARAEKITVSLWLEARIVVVQGVSQVKENRVMRRDARVEQLFVEKHARQSQLRARYEAVCAAADSREGVHTTHSEDYAVNGSGS
ncbi:hypothetical protein AX14_007118 [Amanita brunnescens Koide BX004]|nr:hypothetical protein AX14_007118 [Amanita brunnescens Koide BX004]